MLKLSRLGLPALIIALALLAGLIAGSPAAPADDADHGHAPAGAALDHANKPGEHAEHAPAKEKGIMEKLILHVLDGAEIHIFHTVWPHSIDLATFFGKPLFGKPVTRFLVIEILSGVLIILIYVPLARRVRSGAPAHGWFWNAFEVLLTFVRDQIAKPSIGEEHADRYVPFLWTMFLFILFNNLMGMVPFLGSPTADIFVTGALALVVFFAIHGSAIIEMARTPAHGHGHDAHHGHDEHGHHAVAHEEKPSLLKGAGRYIASLWPQIDLPLFPMGLPIKTLVFCLEVMGVLVRNAVLAIRLFANMFAGHMVVATILLFIELSWQAGVNAGLWGVITAGTVVGIVALSLLEIFVAFLQAYIFTFLAALFMGMAMHPQH